MESASPYRTVEIKHVVITTDGSCLGNPGPGGYGVLIRYKNHRTELSGGFHHTTNSRMELMAAIAGLDTLKERCHVTLRSDSHYLLRALEEGWVERWRANEWMRNKKERALNPDLWARLLDLCDKHKVVYEWVEGHSGDPDNERCDELAKEAAGQSILPSDEGYEAKGNIPVEEESPTHRSAQYIRRGLSSPDAKHRKNAIFRVVEEQLTELAPDILLLMGNEPTTDLKGWCAWALGRLNYHEAYPILVKNLRHRSQVLRTWSAWALGELGDNKARKPLRRALEREKVDNVRQAIGGALKKFEFESTRVHKSQLVKKLTPPMTLDPTLMLMIERLERLEWPADSEEIIEVRADMKRRDPCYFDQYIEWIKRRPAIIAALDDDSKVFG